MNFWVMRALARDNHYAQEERVYENFGCGGFILKVLFIVAIVLTLKKCGVIT